MGVKATRVTVSCYHSQRFGVDSPHRRAYHGAKYRARTQGQKSRRIAVKTAPPAAPGLPRDDPRRPLVGVASCWHNAASGTRNPTRLVRGVKVAGRGADGAPQEFG